MRRSENAAIRFPASILLTDSLKDPALRIKKIYSIRLNDESSFFAIGLNEKYDSLLHCWSYTRRIVGAVCGTQTPVRYPLSFSSFIRVFLAY